MKLANLIIISGIINMPTAIQWHETLSILAYAASILIYPCMYAINQESNVNEWTIRNYPCVQNYQYHAVDRSYAAPNTPSTHCWSGIPSVTMYRNISIFFL